MARINKGKKMDKERKGRNDKNQEMKIKFDKKLKKGGNGGKQCTRVKMGRSVFSSQVLMVSFKFLCIKNLY